MYQIEYTDEFLIDLKKLQKSDRKLITKVNSLIDSIKENYKTGLGKPEQLKGFGQRVIFSRRINQKHRLIYEVIENENKIILLNCFGHYSDK